MKSCYFCNSQLNQKYIINIQNSQNSNFIKEDYCYLIPELRKISCIDCGDKYYKYKYAKNKFSFLKNKEFGIKIKLDISKEIKMYKIEHCVICDDIINNITIYTPVSHRSCYIVGIGQFCSDCYLKYV